MSRVRTLLCRFPRDRYKSRNYVPYLSLSPSLSLSRSCTWITAVRANDPRAYVLRGLARGNVSPQLIKCDNRDKLDIGPDTAN
jgi:hypothetical protein